MYLEPWTTERFTPWINTFNIIIIIITIIIILVIAIVIVIITIIIINTCLFTKMLINWGNTSPWSYWPVRFANTQIFLLRQLLQPQPPQPVVAHPGVRRYRRCHWARLCCFHGLCWRTLPPLYFLDIPLTSAWHQCHQTTPLRLLLHYQNYNKWWNKNAITQFEV